MRCDQIDARIGALRRKKDSDEERVGIFVRKRNRGVGKKIVEDLLDQFSFFFFVHLFANTKFREDRREDVFGDVSADDRPQFAQYFTHIGRDEFRGCTRF